MENSCQGSSFGRAEEARGDVLGLRRLWYGLSLSFGWHTLGLNSSMNDSAKTQIGPRLSVDHLSTIRPDVVATTI